MAWAEHMEEKICFLLRHAAPNVRYRVRREILCENPDSAGMTALQEEILAMPRVRKWLSCQREDGFFGTVIHGVPGDGFDATVDALKRNGVELTHPSLRRARECLVFWEERDYVRDHFYKAGNAMDEHGRGGFRAVLADTLVELGAQETLPQISAQIEAALRAFEGALNYASVDDFTRKATYRGIPCRYYIKGATFPAANHVSLLTKTRSWRTAETLAMVRSSYRHCKELMRGYDGGVIYVNCGHFVGPFNHNWQISPRRVDLREFDGHPIDFAWLMKGLSSPCATYPLFDEENPLLYDTLREWLADEELLSRIGEEPLRLFKKYAALEPSWRRAESVRCDVYFPIVLALSRKTS